MESISEVRFEYEYLLRCSHFLWEIFVIKIEITGGTNFFNSRSKNFAQTKRKNELTNYLSFIQYSSLRKTKKNEIPCYY